MNQSGEGMITANIPRSACASAHFQASRTCSRSTLHWATPSTNPAAPAARPSCAIAPSMTPIANENAVHDLEHGAVRIMDKGHHAEFDHLVVAMIEARGFRVDDDRQPLARRQRP